MKRKFLLSALALAVSGAAIAQPNIAPSPPSQPPALGSGAATPRVDQREVNQERRIQQGVQSGQLTPREAARLEAEQNRVRRAEAAAKADGQVTRQERARLEHMQDRASRDINREKHDRQRDLNHDGRKDRPQGSRPGTRH